MNPLPPPSSPTPATESDGEDDAAWKTRRQTSDQRSTIIFDALVSWSWKEEYYCYYDITVHDLRDAEDYASQAYIDFRDRMPEYQDGDSEDGAVRAYNAFRDRLGSIKKKRARNRRVRDRAGKVAEKIVNDESKIKAKCVP